MKKINAMIVLIAAVLITTTSAAQVTFAIGPKVGINFSSTSYDPDVQLPADVTKSGQVGIMFGAAAKIGFGKMFAIQLEPMYNQAGDKFERGAAKVTNTASFLDIPILFKVEFLEGSVRPYGIVGPGIGITLSAKAKTEGVGAGFDGEVDTKSTTSSTNFSILLGGGAAFKVAPKIAITGDVRYSLGLSNLNSTAGSTQSIKVRGFQIAFGALFTI